MSPPSPESTPVDDLRLPALNRTGHVAHCVRCLDGLPASLVEMDASRFASLLSLLTPFDSFPELRGGMRIYPNHGIFIFITEWRLCFIVWARSTSPAWRSRRYRRRIVAAGKSGSGINMSVRGAHSFSLFVGGSHFFCLGSLLCVKRVNF